MQFFADVEDKKTSAAKAGAKEREKAAKDAAQKAKEAAKEEAEKDKKLIESEQKLLDAQYKTYDAVLKERLKEAGYEVERYADGPLLQLVEALAEVRELQLKIAEGEKNNTLDSLFYGADENIRKVIGSVDELRDHYEALSLDQNDLYWQIANGLGDKEQETFMNNMDAFLQSVKLARLKFENEEEEISRNLYKSIGDGAKRTGQATVKNAEFIYKQLLETVEKLNVDPVRHKFSGLIDTKETQKKLEEAKQYWVKALTDINGLIQFTEDEWDSYIEKMMQLYGKDSQKYKDAVQEKIEALKRLKKIQEEVGIRANAPTSGSNDYNGDNKRDVRENRKLWYGKGDKKQNGDEYSFIDNMANMFQSLDEMVLAPAMDTFSMFMDFAIEETQQKLEQVEKMHDDALDKVEESADKISELNASLKDSSNDNMEVTKQQLADEQLLYAQRLAEEQKLAEQEKALKNKAAKQEANARKMELRYQMVMGIANTAQGASKALATWGWPLGPIFAGIMAALGAVQVAMIAKQIGQVQPVKYAEGGLLSGPAHSNGGIKVGNTGVEVEGNEYVVNKRSTAKYLPLLEAINAEGNRRPFSNPDKRIRKYANGGTLNFDKTDENLRQRNDTNRLINAIDGIDMQPVVAVKDIWRAEDRLVKVRSLAGR